MLPGPQVGGNQSGSLSLYVSAFLSLSLPTVSSNYSLVHLGSNKILWGPSLFKEAQNLIMIPICFTILYGSTLALPQKRCGRDLNHINDTPVLINSFRFPQQNRSNNDFVHETQTTKQAHCLNTFFPKTNSSQLPYSRKLPRNPNMDQNGDLQDLFFFKRDDFQVPALIFPGSTLKKTTVS